MYKLYRADLVTDAAGNNSCGAWRSLGNTVGLSAVDKAVMSGKSYCYALSAVVNVDGVPIESPLSDPAIASVP
jgi:hypothetical protein